jgi:Protein of unknown function (DUF3108)
LNGAVGIIWCIEETRRKAVEEAKRIQPEAIHSRWLLRARATYHYYSQVPAKLKFSLKSAQLMALLVLLTCTIAAQDRGPITSAPLNDAAYRLGERLTYNVQFSHYSSAAHVDLLVAGRGTFFDREGIQLRAHVETVGIVNVALLSINNDYTTYVDPQTGLPYRAQTVVREAGRTAEADRDYNQPAGTDAIPSKLKTGEASGTYDLLSALYRIRSMPLTDGASYFMTVEHEGEQFQAQVRVSGRELIKTNVGSFNTIITRVDVKNSRDYHIYVYFSDDERHVPVLILAKVSSGEIRAELAGSELTLPEPASKSTPTPTTSLAPRDPPVRTPTPRPAPGNQLAPNTVVLPPLRDVPFKVGEQLTYQVYLPTAPAESVGTITFTLKARGRYFNRDGLFFAVNAQTTGPGARIYPVNDQINSYVDPSTLLPFRSELNLSEGKFKSARGYNLDQNRGAAVSDSKERVEIPVGTHDLISAVYAIRTFDLWPKKRNAISIMAISEPRTLFVESQRKETLELGGQKIPAIMLTLTTDDPQSDKLQIRMWIGDDARRLPLRITALTQFGIVRADLAVGPAH